MESYQLSEKILEELCWKHKKIGEKWAADRSKAGLLLVRGRQLGMWRKCADRQNTVCSYFQNGNLVESIRSKMAALRMYY